MPHNIILFLTDQWRWDTINDPKSQVHLPNLKQFSDKATNFTHAFSPVPLCTPARASLFTGKWPHQTGTMDNVQGRSYYPQGCLHAEQITYLERLRDAGYEVAYLGKWHLGERGLIDRGFKQVILSDGGDEPIPKKPPELPHVGPFLSPYYGTVTQEETADGFRVKKAIAKLDDFSKSTKPFCLVVSLHGPHFPHFVPRPYVDLYSDLPSDYQPANFCPQFSEQNKPVAQSRSYWHCQETADLTAEDWRRTAQHYFGFCSYIDKLFGDFVQAVQTRNLDEKTVVAFTSDHGEMLGAHGWFDKGPFFYEEVIRIPMLIRSPGARENCSLDNFVSLKDLWPTLADKAQIADMLNPEETTSSYFNSNNASITYCYDSYQGRQFKFRGIRNSRYKYAWSPHDLSELYDLDTDPGERINLSGNPNVKELEKQLHDQLHTWMKNESDYLGYPSHHLPVGSYVDGRDRAFDPENLIPGR